MKYFGVWFHGNSQEPADICYEGRNAATYSKVEDAQYKLAEMQEWCPEEKYSIFEFEIKE